jgi:hypothetical protein
MTQALSNFLSVKLADNGNDEGTEVVRMSRSKWVVLVLSSLAQVTADVSLIAFTAPESG